MIGWEGPMGEYKPWNRNPILTQRHLAPLGLTRPLTATLTEATDRSQRRPSHTFLPLSSLLTSLLS